MFKFRGVTKLAIRVRSRVAAGLPTGYSGLGGNLTGYCCQQYRPRLDNRGGNGTHRGLCWKQVVPSIPGGDFRRLPTLNKRPLPFKLFDSHFRYFPMSMSVPVGLHVMAQNFTNKRITPFSDSSNCKSLLITYFCPYILLITDCLANTLLITDFRGTPLTPSAIAMLGITRGLQHFPRMPRDLSDVNNWQKHV